MALRWVDSFDGYTTAQLSAKYLDSLNATIVSGQGRRGTNAAINSGNQGCIAFPMIQDPYTFLGFAMKPASVDIAAGNNAFCGFMNGLSTALLGFLINSSGGLTVLGNASNSAGYTVGTTPGGYLIANEYHQYELDIKWTTDTTGYIDFYRDSVLFYAMTGIQTMTPYAAGNGQPTLCVIGSHLGMTGNAPSSSYIDDLYLCDSSGSFHNTGPIGDRKVVIMVPNGAGALTQFSVTGESENWQSVSQNPPLYDDAYVSSTTVGDQDAYTLTTPATGFTAVEAVAVTVLARKDDAGDRTIAAGVGNGTTEAYGAAYGLGADFTYAQTIFDGENPITEADWTPSDLTTLQAALKIVS